MSESDGYIYGILGAIMKMEEIDLKLKLLGGRPVTIEDYGTITPLTIKEVMDYGYTQYMINLNILSIEVEDFLNNEVQIADEDKPHIFDLLVRFGGEDVEKQIEASLSLFLKGNAMLDKENHQFIIESGDEVRLVDRENYDSVREVIKYQNYINHFEEKNLNSFNPANEEARKLKERMEKLKKKKEEIKKKSSDSDGEVDLDFYDILSALSSKSYGLNEMSINNLTIYQVYSKFKRLELIDQYEISIKSILAGAKDVKLKHWSSKIG